MSEGYSFIEGERVRLWDGKMYPRARVEQEMAGLSDYANEHDSLTETAPSRLGNVLVRILLMWLFFDIVVGALFFLVGGDLVAAIVVATLITVCATALTETGTLWIAQRWRPTITVRDGEVIIRQGRRMDGWPLESFQWYRGRARHDRTLKSGAYPNVRTIVLVTRSKIGWLPAMRYRVACGFTPQMRARWEAFLTLAGVPYGRRGFIAKSVRLRHNESRSDNSEVTCDDSETGR